ncbi:SAM-dependent methyltransferase [Actinomadura fulvescens]|uniref:SAM-dependent methyltransferase n=1 Tax=Actinomadura fulvescens TaxID=46160 RepID=A0ABN3QHJ3_9ACTN
MPSADSPQQLDLTAATSAGMYNHYLSGKDTTAADRTAADAVMAAAGGWQTQAIAVENFKFAGRAARYGVHHLRIRQALDIGVGRLHGIPHQTVEQRIREAMPDAVVLGCDNDAVVLAGARGLRQPDYDAVFKGDARDPEQIFAHPELTTRFDLTQPVLIVLAAVLHFIPDDHDPAAILRRMRELVAPGSGLVLSHACCTGIPARVVAEITERYRATGGSFTFRSLSDIEQVLTDAGWSLLAPLDDVQSWAPPGETYDGYTGGPIASLRCVGTVAVSRPTPVCSGSGARP